jgi:RNA polymerase sigma-70 factor (ECF subfamily)
MAITGHSHEQVMQELVTSQFELFSYICMLTGHSSDARDILQETNLKIFKQADSYNPQKPFIAWAKTIAVYEVMTWRKKCQRGRLVFDDDVFKTLLAQADEESIDTEQTYARLDECIRKLPDTLRQAIEERYLKGFSVQETAKHLERSDNAVSLLLMRARQLLADCVQRPLMEGGLA